MTYYPYLVALALIDQNGQRAMPLGGKSIKTSINTLQEPGKDAEKVTLEILLRVFQRTEKGCISRNAGDLSLILLEISMEAMNEQLPSLKSEWLNSGDTNAFLSNLKKYSKNIWAINYIKHKGIFFKVLS